MRKLIAFVFLCSLTALAVNPGFRLSVFPSKVTVQQGNIGTTTITVTMQGNYAAAVSFAATSGVPAGTTVTFSPNPIPYPGNGHTLMSMDVGASTAVGTYVITVTATGGIVHHTIPVTLVVTAAPPVPDFTINANPTSLSVVQGAQGTSTITTTVSGGFNNAISLSASGVPAGVTVSFNPNPIAAPGSGSSTMTIAVDSSTVPGTYPIAVTGNGGGIQHSTTVTLTVTAAPPPHQVNLSWVASTTTTVVGYNAYRSTVSGSYYTQINSGLIPGLTYVDTTVTSGVTYYYVTTAVDADGLESVYSNEASANVP